MTKPITGQYEYQHSSGVGLDYFTSRLDRLTLHPDGHFVLIIQEKSRLSNAAQSVMKGQSVNMSAPEVRFEGRYTAQGNVLSFQFDDGTQEQGQLSWNGEGMQFGPNFFTKVSDSTVLPPTHRLKKDMDDIAKGLKIASTIGGMAVKAAKTIHDTVQPVQENDAGTTPATPPVQQAQPVQQPQAPQRPQQPPAASARPVQPMASSAVFCDQCGERVRPGKRFCNHCGAPLP